MILQQFIKYNILNNEYEHELSYEGRKIIVNADSVFYCQIIMKKKCNTFHLWIPFCEPIIKKKDWLIKPILKLCFCLFEIDWFILQELIPVLNWNDR